MNPIKKIVSFTAPSSYLSSMAVLLAYFATALTSSIPYTLPAFQSFLLLMVKCDKLTIEIPKSRAIINGKGADRNAI
jgi:hypothetical protein